MSLDMSYENTSYASEQARRMRHMFASAVMEHMDVAIALEARNKDTDNEHEGREKFLEWARSEDGVFVMTMAGMEHDETTLANMMSFINRGVRTAVALSSVSRERA